MNMTPGGFDAPLLQGTYFTDLQNKIADLAGNGTSVNLILLGMDTGMDPDDISFLNLYTATHGYLIVFRCPKQAAFAYQGKYKPKIWKVKTKSDEFGIARSDHGDFVSDYDMMCFWEKSGNVLRPIHMAAVGSDGVTPSGAGRGAYSTKATRILREMNAKLKSRLQHGCQDDYYAPPDKHPGVSDKDRFLAIRWGAPFFMRDRWACRSFYTQHGMPWHYNDDGKWCGPVVQKELWTPG